jgi:hypothetical protein
VPTCRHRATRAGASSVVCARLGTWAAAKHCCGRPTPASALGAGASVGAQRATHDAASREERTPRHQHLRWSAALVADSRPRGALVRPQAARLHEHSPATRRRSGQRSRVRKRCTAMSASTAALCAWLRGDAPEQQPAEERSGSRRVTAGPADACGADCNTPGAFMAGVRVPRGSPRLHTAVAAGHAQQQRRHPQSRTCARAVAARASSTRR